jgi:hypothetical protein
MRGLEDAVLGILFNTDSSANPTCNGHSDSWEKKEARPLVSLLWDNVTDLFPLSTANGCWLEAVIIGVVRIGGGGQKGLHIPPSLSELKENVKN